MIWIGGLVTTSGAGMAVPDWPNTYGYNLFLYPWQTWAYGPWKLFIEHGHRLFGTVVGMVTIGLLVSAWCCRSRPLVRWLSVVALGGVLLQGALGGMRVLADEVRIAQIHGVVGPAFFAFTIAIAAITSQRWQTAERVASASLAKLERVALFTTLLAFIQLVLGSQLRHLGPGSRPGEFRLVLFFHLAVAAMLLIHILLLAVRTLVAHRGERWLVRPVLGLVATILLQLTLGAGAWITKYGFPAWMSGFEFAAAFRPTADSPLQMSVTTAHVAIGSMILGTSLLLALRAMRLVAPPEKEQKPLSHGRMLRMEAVR